MPSQKMGGGRAGPDKTGQNAARMVQSGARVAQKWDKMAQ